MSLVPNSQNGLPFEVVHAPSGAKVSFRPGAARPATSASEHRMDVLDGAPNPLRAA
ncbi:MULTISPECIES: hypothetical protein [Hyphomonas]|uniref:hypothetical protein n=1 Tax=Hyphomonas TaxID=85 RepID=UPI0012DD91B0|nr:MULTISPECIES: hypothetical protein [Hyphomonas]